MVATLQVKNKHMKITDNLYHNLAYDWDAHINTLHGKDLWDTPNMYSRGVRKMVVDECERVAEKIRRLPWHKRLFNIF